MYAAVMLALLATGEGKDEVKVLAQTSWSHAKASTDSKNDARQIVITSEADLDKAAGQKDSAAALAKAMKVDKIDWDKQMLVVVTAGSKPSGGYSVEVTGLKAKDKTLTVSWKVHAPKGFATAAFTHPGVVALVPRHDKVVFDPPVKKDDK